MSFWTDTPISLGNPDVPTLQDYVDGVAPGTSSQVNANQGPGETWTDTLQRLLPTLAATYQQKQILDIQMQRARSGLPPLDASQYGVGVSLGVSPEVKSMLVIAGVGLAAYLMLSRKG